MPEYWYMLPLALCISTLALTSGVAGATFFTPLFLLWLGLPLRVAIAASLITATFGFASGLVGYYRRRLIDFRIGARLLAASIPAALLGAWLATRVDASLLRTLLGLGLSTIAVGFLRTERPAPASAAGVNSWEGAAFAGVGGMSLGMISAGLGELNAYYLIRRRGLPTDTAVATSVLVVALTVAVAAAGHVVGLLAMDTAARSQVARLVAFTIPGVVVGAQIGCHIGARAPRAILQRLLGVVFLAVALMVIYPLVAG